jgi:hypothetical protein
MELELECQCDIEKDKVDPTRSLQQEKKKLSNIHGNREPK